MSTNVTKDPTTFHTVGHRTRRPPAGILALGVLAASTIAAAGPVESINAEAAKAPITTQPLRKGMFVLSGSGGNITVLVRNGDALLVDSGISVSRDRIREALTAIGVKRIRRVLITHYHWDHTDGNEWMRGEGATIEGHPGTLAHLSQETTVPEWEHTFPPAAEAARPTVLLRGGERIDFGGERIRVVAPGDAHTDTDLFFKFERADVVSLGDLFWNGVYPFIDTQNGGSIDGAIAAATLALESVGKDTIVVSGHGPVGNRADLVRFRDMLVAARNSVAPLKAQGLPLEEVVTRDPTRELDPIWGGFVVKPALFTRLVFTTLR
jgi:glyoxylase-like metal-dependent hydrolase (beta-lactamase superfamily II)